MKTWRYEDGSPAEQCSGHDDCLCTICLLLLIHNLEREDFRFGAMLKLARIVRARAGIFGLSLLISSLRPKSTSSWKITVERRRAVDVPAHRRDNWLKKAKDREAAKIAHEVIVARKKAGLTMLEAFELVAAQPWHLKSWRTIANAYYVHLATVGDGYKDPVAEVLQFLTHIYGPGSWDQIPATNVTAADFPRRKGETGRPKTYKK